MKPWERRAACDNLNHRRARSAVRHCPTCGEVLNDRIDARPCSDAAHAAARRTMTAFCMDCGTALIADR